MREVARPVTLLMSGEKLYIDSVFIAGPLNRNDQHHAPAKALYPRVKSALEVWVTEAVLTEVANILAKGHREVAAKFISSCYRAPNFRIVSVDSALLRRSLDLYADRGDKEWGLTDCISFEVTWEQSLRIAATGDHHFQQAGFTALMIDN